MTENQHGMDMERNYVTDSDTLFLGGRSSFSVTIPSTYPVSGMVQRWIATTNSPTGWHATILPRKQKNFGFPAIQWCGIGRGWTRANSNKQHVLHSTLPGTRDTKYHLRPRLHNFKLTAKNSSITECDFITRMLFKDVYWHYVFFHCYFMYSHSYLTCVVFYSPLFYHV